MILDVVGDAHQTAPEGAAIAFATILILAFAIGWWAGRMHERRRLCQKGIVFYDVLSAYPKADLSAYPKAYGKASAEEKSS